MYESQFGQDSQISTAYTIKQNKTKDNKRQNKNYAYLVLKFIF